MSEPNAERASSRRAPLLRAGTLLAVFLVLVGFLLVRSRFEPEAPKWGRATLPPDEVERLLPETTPRLASLYEAIEALRPLFPPPGPPQPGDWTEHHPEPGETFKAYVVFNPCADERVFDGLRVTMYDDVPPDRARIVERAVRYAGLSFGMPVVIEAERPTALVPDRARRTSPETGEAQVLTKHVLDALVRQRGKGDRALRVACIDADVWPGAGWRYVFGQSRPASLVAAISLHRLRVGADEEVLLRRVIKAMTHEVGHLLSLQHCTAYHCNMRGADPLSEFDRYPSWLCPECLAKVCWVRGMEPAERHRALAEFCEGVGLEREAEHHARCAEALAADR